MTRLIIGCGYIGRRVLDAWKGQPVYTTTRRKADELRSLGATPIECDVLAPAALRDLPALDTVVYAVGLDRSAGHSMRSVYVEGLARVLDVLAPCRNFLYVSSSSVYGQIDGGWVDEDADTVPGEESGRVVLEAEQLLRAKCPQAIILRFSGIYGPGRLLRRQAIERGDAIVGDAEKWLNLIHVEDGARVVLAAEARGQLGRTYNVCDDEPVRRRDFYREMAKALGAPEPKFAPVPPGQETPPHESANRRIRNRRLKEELGVALAYPNYREGLAGSTS